MMYLLPLLCKMIDGLQIESFCPMGTDVVEWFSHNTGFVEFLSVLLGGQFRLPFLFTECMKKHLISCLSMTISLNVFQSCFYILHPFSMLSHSLSVRGHQSFLFCCYTPFFEILLLNLSTYWQWYYTQNNNLHPQWVFNSMDESMWEDHKRGWTNKEIYFFMLHIRKTPKTYNQDTGRSTWQTFL